MLPNIMRASSFPIGGPQWLELEEDAEEVDKVRDDEPDELGGVGSWNGACLPE